jgi:hypothetical protein
VSLLEVYNEALYDLLSPQPASNEHLAVLEDGRGHSYVSEPVAAGPRGGGARGGRVVAGRCPSGPR